MRERFTPHERDDTRELTRSEADEIVKEYNREFNKRRVEKALSTLKETELKESEELRNEVRSRVKIESNDESLAYLLGAMRDGQTVIRITNDVGHGGGPCLRQQGARPGLCLAPRESVLATVTASRRSPLDNTL